MAEQAISKDAIKALYEVGIVIAELVASRPEGFPSGELYALLMPYGFNLPSYEKFMVSMEGAGRVRKAGLLYLAPA